jgi:two-component sensor histidine kinase
MREINHRAKNMLSVVDAIAHQTATRNPTDFVERFSERIQALSANQDLQVRNEWNGVGIEDLVRAQLALFADLIGTRIAVNGPKLRLRAASAQAIGLALHELATNAAFPAGQVRRQVTSEGA